MKRAILAVLSLLLAAKADAGLVYQQPPDPGGQVFVSSWYPPDGTDYDNFVYDSFVLPSATAVTELTWRGGYLYTGYGLITDFTITFYASTAGDTQPLCGIPGDNDTFLAQYHVGGTAGQTPAGTFGGIQMYDYHYTLPTPFQAAAGTKYWVQIEGSTAGLPFWGISAGTGGNGAHFEFSRGAHMFSSRSRDVAFSLFAAAGPTYTITTSEAPAGSGLTDGGGTFPPGTIAVVTATPYAGWGFIHWTENGTVVSQSPTYSFTVNANRNLVANFVTAYTVTASCAPVWGGMVTGDGVYNSGTSVTVTATSDFGFDFVNWTEYGVPVCNTPSYTFTSDTDRYLEANFTLGAASVFYDFDSAEPPCLPMQSMPSSQTSRGLTASLHAPSGSWSIQTDGTTWWHLSQFYANYLYPNTAGSTLAVGFSEPISAIALDFCTADFHQIEIPTSVRLNAYADSTRATLVGTASAHGTYGTDTMPMGTISFASSTPFRYVELATIWEPSGTNYFFCDNVMVLRSSTASVAFDASRARLALQASPTPSSGALDLTFDLAQAGLVVVSAHDASGRRVRAIAEGWMDGGHHRLSWDARDDRGARVPTGIYFLSLRAGAEVTTARAVVYR